MNVLVYPKATGGLFAEEIPVKLKGATVVIGSLVKIPQEVVKVPT
jgi:hypothetical protein